MGREARLLDHRVVRIRALVFRLTSVLGGTSAGENGSLLREPTSARQLASANRVGATLGGGLKSLDEAPTRGWRIRIDWRVSVADRCYDIFARLVVSSEGDSRSALPLWASWV